MEVTNNQMVRFVSPLLPPPPSLLHHHRTSHTRPQHTQHNTAPHTTSHGDKDRESERERERSETEKEDRGREERKRRSPSRACFTIFRVLTCVLQSLSNHGAHMDVQICTQTIHAHTDIHVHVTHFAHFSRKKKTVWNTYLP